MVGCVLPAVRIHWTMAPATANHRPVAADCVFLQSAYKKTSHSRPLVHLSYSSMKENIVITLADDKTANNFRGAALAGISIGISETSCAHQNDSCVHTTSLYFQKTCCGFGNMISSIWLVAGKSYPAILKVMKKFQIIISCADSGEKKKGTSDKMWSPGG